jgi:hypothetical protein
VMQNDNQYTFYLKMLRNESEQRQVQENHKGRCRECPWLDFFCIG